MNRVKFLIIAVIMAAMLFAGACTVVVDPERETVQVLQGVPETMAVPTAKPTADPALVAAARSARESSRTDIPLRTPEAPPVPEATLIPLMDPALSAKGKYELLILWQRDRNLQALCELKTREQASDAATVCAGNLPATEPAATPGPAAAPDWETLADMDLTLLWLQDGNVPALCELQRRRGETDKAEAICGEQPNWDHVDIDALMFGCRMEATHDAVGMFVAELLHEHPRFALSVLCAWVKEAWGVYDRDTCSGQATHAARILYAELRQAPAHDYFSHPNRGFWQNRVRDAERWETLYAESWDASCSHLETWAKSHTVRYKHGKPIYEEWFNNYGYTITPGRDRGQLHGTANRTGCVRLAVRL